MEAVCSSEGHAMSLAASGRPAAEEDRVRSRFSPGCICGEQSGSGTVFSPICSVFPCKYYSIVVLHSHMPPEG
jgi:hypothetical protein